MTVVTAKHDFSQCVFLIDNVRGTKYNGKILKLHWGFSSEGHIIQDAISLR